MEPYYFGANKELFGIYYPPLGGAERRPVLIVPPLFCDYVRSERVLRHVALRLSETGFPVLRFDLRGTGDSFGSLETLTRHDWVTDLVCASQELLAVAGADRLHVMAVRYGALLLPEASAKIAFDVALLWDPETRGDDLLDELAAGRGVYVSWERPAREASEAAGFRLELPFLESWRGIQLDPLTCRRRVDVVTQGHPLDAAAANRVETDCGWKAADLDNLIHPHSLLGPLTAAFQ